MIQTSFQPLGGTTTSQPRGISVLVADDQSDVLEALRLLLKAEGYDLELVNSPSSLLNALSRRTFDLLLMDLNYARDTTSGREGLDLLSRIRAIDDSLPILAMTAWGSIELAVEIMREGVRDFVLKPWDNTRLLAIVRREIENGQRARKAKRQAALSGDGGFSAAQDWEDAQRTQLGFLPKEVPEIPGWQFSGAWLPVRGIGGDYFDVLRLDATRFAFCIADVAGKGVAAALLMSNLQAIVRSLAAQNLPPSELARRLNEFIGANTASDRFITFFYAILNTDSQRFVYTNAGHNPPVVMSRDGAVVRLSAGGKALGISPYEQYEQAEVELAAGDCVMLFTDGITESAAAEGEEFGEDRLIRTLCESRNHNAAEMQKQILARVAEFNGGKFQDDASLVLLASDDNPETR